MRMLCRIGLHRWRLSKRRVIHRVDLFGEGPVDVVSSWGNTYGFVCARCFKRDKWPDIGQRWTGPAWWHGEPETTFDVNGD